MKINHEKKIVSLMKIRFYSILTCILFFFSFSIKSYATDLNGQTATQSNPFATSADLVIFAYFTDDTAESASAYFNEQGKYATFKNYFMGSSGRSFANYMAAISYEKFTVNVCMPQEQADGTIVPIAIPISQAAAKTQNVDAQIVQAVMDAMPSLENYAVDRDQDGFIDNITIICKAEDCSNVSSGASLVAHANSSGNQGTVQGYGVSKYNIISTDRLENGQSALIAHEYLHTLGYPDLYRTDGTSDYPVYIWDIMGAVSSSPTYPLAFLRSEITKWFTIQTISSNGTYTLNSQKDATGNKALIIKSPLRDTEFFVVEYRQRPSNIYDQNTLDRPLVGSGIIVYRVNKTVEEYSNAHGGTGIYVFRPQPGQASYYGSSEAVNVARAFLSQESGRTSIGSADMNAGLTDGALTFSDGSNSGIVISEVGSAAGDTITFTLTYPDLSTADLWENTSFSSTNGNMNENVAIALLDQKLYALEYDGTGFTAYKQMSGNWIKTSDKLSVSSSSFNGQMKFFAKSDSLYLAYGDWDSNLYLKKLDTTTGSWVNLVNKKGMGENFDVTVIGNDLYISYGDASLKLAKFDGDDFTDLGEAYRSSWLMGASKIRNVDGNVYIFGRDAVGNSLVGYGFESGTFTKITNDVLKGNAFDVTAANGKIYVAYTATSDSKLCMAVYDGKDWATTQSEIDSSDVVMTQLGGNVYVLSSPASTKESFRMYRFDGGTFLNEGDTVIDASSSCFSLLNNNEDTLYISYVRASDYKGFVKCKKVNGGNVTKPENGGGSGAGDNPGDENTPNTPNNPGDFGEVSGVGDGSDAGTINGANETITVTPVATIKLSATKKTLKRKKKFVLTISNIAVWDSVKLVKANKKYVVAIKKIAKNRYKITAKKKGKAVISVVLKSGKTAKCMVKVK